MSATILVIGREGQLARALAERAAALGRPLAAVGRPDVDLTRPETIEAVLDREAPAAIVNAAAYTAVDKAESEPDAAYAINRDGVAALAGAAAKRDIPLVHVSTDYVFDGTKPAPYVETDMTGPACLYGATKRAGEQAVAAAGGRAVTLRTAWVTSSFGGNFVKTMLRLAGERDRLRVVDDQRGNPTSARDLADAALALIDRGATAGWPWAPGEVFHAAGSGETTWCGFAREIFAISEAAGGPSCAVEAITTAEYPTLAKRPANSRLDCSKLAATLGRPFPDWRGSLQKTVLRLLAER
jgi:dTDP-4-dehydrorhamnose reductase